MWNVLIVNSSKNMTWQKSDCVSEVEAQSWLQSQIGKPHRLPEREVSIEDDYEQEDVLEVIQENVQIGVDEENNAIYELQDTKVRLKAQFTSEIVDISSQVASEAEQAAARKLLADTDWLIIREMDSGVPCPQEIKDQRAAARLVL